MSASINTASIVVSNIPPNFTEQDVLMLLSQAGVQHASDRGRIFSTKDGYCRRGTNRYMVVNLGDGADVATAIESLSNINLMINQKQHQLYFAPLIQGFAERVKKGVGMIVVKNLPKDVSVNSLRSVFSSFGQVLTVKINNPDSRRVNNKSDTTGGPKVTGYVMFSTDEEADRAVAETNGKFLGVNKVSTERFLNVEERMKIVKRVFFKNIPPKYKDDPSKLKELIATMTGKTGDELFGPNVEVRLTGDSRPVPYRSENFWSILQTLTPEACNLIIDSFAAKTDPKEIDEIVACKALSKGLRTLELRRKLQENYEELVSAKKNLSIFGLKTDLDQEKFEKELKERYGAKKVGFPFGSRKDGIDPMKFHVNVSFNTADEARNVMEKLTRETLADYVRGDGDFKVDYFTPDPRSKLAKVGAPKLSAVKKPADREIPF